MATSGSGVAPGTLAASDPAAAFESSFAKRLASLEESFSAKAEASPSKGSKAGQSPSKGSKAGQSPFKGTKPEASPSKGATMRSRSGSQIEKS
jgi:hypothetical protein